MKIEDRNWSGKLTHDNKEAIHTEITKLFSEAAFCVDASTCMLCELYLPNPISDDEEEEDSELECPDCPIYKATCSSCSASFETPFGKWLTFYDPEPMITLLTSLKDSLPTRNDEVNNGEHI